MNESAKYIFRNCNHFTVKNNPIRFRSCQKRVFCHLQLFLSYLHSSGFLLVFLLLIKKKKKQLISVLTCDIGCTAPSLYVHERGRLDGKVDMKIPCYAADNKNHKRCNVSANVKRDRHRVFWSRNRRKLCNTNPQQSVQ
jgi:hypothetical protein